MKHVSLEEIVAEKDQNKRAQQYNQYVKKVTPKHRLLWNVWNAFWVGGLICTIGQAFILFYQSLGVNQEKANLYNTVTLIFLSVVLTALHLYSKIAKVAGAGTIVPITGFANSVASAAIEFKKEGQVFGIGSKIFTIAGPVILYGIFSSWILGVIYWIFKR